MTGPGAPLLPTVAAVPHGRVRLAAYREARIAPTESAAPRRDIGKHGASLGAGPPACGVRPGRLGRGLGHLRAALGLAVEPRARAVVGLGGGVDPNLAGTERRPSLRPGRGRLPVSPGARRVAAGAFWLAGRHPALGDAQPLRVRAGQHGAVAASGGLSALPAKARRRANASGRRRMAWLPDVRPRRAARGRMQGTAPTAGTGKLRPGRHGQLCRIKSAANYTKRRHEQVEQRSLLHHARLRTFDTFLRLPCHSTIMAIVVEVLARAGSCR